MTRVIWAAVRHRRLQSLVIGLVIVLTSGTAVLALGLLIGSDAPFDRAFARQRGAQATVSFDAARASAADLAATAGSPGVTAAAGPYETVATVLEAGPMHLPSQIAGRDTTASAVDRLQVADGTWLTGPGQIVLSRNDTPSGRAAPKTGSTVTVDVPGRPTLRVVGFADSVTGSATAWVWPTQSNVLHATGAGRQMLYRFADATTETAVRSSLARATAGLPAGAVTGTSTYLEAKLRVNGNLKPMVPFVVAFGVLGIVMSALIVVNVVAGAVVAGFRAIGVQKALGFTPAQVVAVYTGQILAVCVPATLLGTALGWLGARPLLADTARAYHVSGNGMVPYWALLCVLLGMPLLGALAALGPAARAGRLSAVQAITVGRAPRTGRGFRIRRALAATRLPRAVSFGLGTPFARPARAAVTLVAILLGATTVVFAAGLAHSLTRIVDAFDRTSAIPITITPRGPSHQGPPTADGPPAIDATAARAALATVPGTAHMAAITEEHVGLAGSGGEITVRAYDSDASWTGYPILSGRWYSAPGEAVASSRMLHLTGAKVGDYVTITTDLGRRRLHLVGEVFANGTDGTAVMSLGELDGLVPKVRPSWLEVGLDPGTDPHAYAEAANTKLAPLEVGADLTDELQQNEAVAVMLGLIGTLTLLLAAVAALGVFNTVVLNTRERMQEIGILKSIGMTPGQVRLMVVTSMAAIGIPAGALAAPAGWLLHRAVLPIMADATGTGLPASVLTAFHPAELTALGLCGVVLAVLGALVPAGWAARTRAANALRAE
jgi:putative ABC transport system permease protein